MSKKETRQKHATRQNQNESNAKYNMSKNFPHCHTMDSEILLSKLSVLPEALLRVEGKPDQAGGPVMNAL